MKNIDTRVLLIVLQLTLVVLEIGSITTRGGWGDPNTWSGILLGFNLGAVTFGWLLYKQGQLLDEVMRANHKNLDFLLDMLKELEKAGASVKVTEVKKDGKVVAKGTDGRKAPTKKTTKPSSKKLRSNN